MQTLSEIRRMLADARLAPHRTLGQNFLIDANLMAKLLDLAELADDDALLEVGAGTGSLTEELLQRARRVVAVEIDRGLFRLLSRRLGGREDLQLIHGDVLAGKRAISPAVLEAVRPRARLVANLPYSIATPLVTQCLVCSWRAAAGAAAAEGGGEGSGAAAAAEAVLFDRLTFTVQQEVAERFAASPGSKTYGPVSVVVALLGRLRLGSAVPASAFYPRPRVAGRFVRIDFDAGRAARLRSVDTLQTVLALAFAQRRKQIGSILRRRDAPLPAAALAAALQAAGIDRTARAETVAPEQYLALADALLDA
jgi:16S rRNA (adenine1518-N6/adenine1519-N6)-dimethyltransferase